MELIKEDNDIENVISDVLPVVAVSNDVQRSDNILPIGM